MISKLGKLCVFVLTGIICLLTAAPLAPQGAPQDLIPETILPEKMIRHILNEISGQLAFNNEVMMAGFNHIRTPEEFEGHFYEAEYLYQKLREYGIDDVTLEALSYDAGRRGNWWARVDADLWMVSPEEKRLSRLAEHPALMARGCDEGEWEAELIYLDQRDIPPSFREPLNADVEGKIILTPESLGLLSRRAFDQGAVGIISYKSHAKPYTDPYQAFFDMRLYKGENTKHKVFGFKVWQQLGDELKNMLFRRQKVIVRAKTKTATYPMKVDTILATIRGKDPEKKGFLFTAHLFERPVKQGANDNVSGCVVLAEIARTITALIDEGKIERPERNIYFLMGEEGGSTIGFFRKYPEMAEKIFGVYNFDMVGENLDTNHAFFNMMLPLYSKTSFIDSVAKDSLRYVFETNIERHALGSDAPWVDFPVPIVEKNGTRQPFRYLINSFEGGSDHQTFIFSDEDISACHFMVWPDFWYHTDKDRPDKSDPTQLKRVAFIGAISALSMCSGDGGILRNLIRTVFEDRLGFIQEAVIRSVGELSKMKTGDGGMTYQNAVHRVEEAAGLAQVALKKVKELTQGKETLDEYLDDLIDSTGKLPSLFVPQLDVLYRISAKHNGFEPAFRKKTDLENNMMRTVPVKTESIPLGGLDWLSPISMSIAKHGGLNMEKFYADYGFQYMIELYLSVDGKRTIDRIKGLMDLEFKPIPAEDLMKILNAWEKEKLVIFRKI